MAYFLELYKQLTSSGEDSLSSKDKARTPNTKASSDDLRRKKKDALEGKDQKKHNSNEREDKKGDGAKEGKGGSEGGGHQSSQSLQSGQTTVQFSSGGGLASLGSLMALFGSSAALARAAAGNALNANPSNALSGRSGFQDPAIRQDAFANQEGKNLKETAAVTGTASEGAGAKSNFEITKITLAHDTSNTQSTLTSLLKNVSAATSTADSTTASSPVTLFNANFGGFIYVQTFNGNNFFFSPQILFAFPNSQPIGAVLPNGSQALSPYVGEISTILTAAGVSTASTYSYQVANPLSVSNLSNPSSTGITITPGGTALSVTVDTPPPFPVTTAMRGLTISASGDLYVNVDHPLSVVVNVQTSPTSPIVPIRLDVGPGNEVTDVINTIGSTTGIMMGSTTGSSVFRDVDPTGYTIIGNGVALDISASGVVTTLKPDATLSSQFTLSSSGIYAFPENTIYRHIGTSAATLPVAATYGNFASLPTAVNTINLPEAPSSYTLQMGGNVLDVYGTKYGVADQLDVILPATGAGNMVILGGNTLAGFGTSYGDLQTLTVSAQTGTSAATSGTTEFLFRGNVLAVDKGIGSILYPHLQTLDLENTSSSSPVNVQIRFENSIIQGNQGSDTFYGDIQNLSDASNPQNYDGFLKGVSVTTVGGHLVTADGNNNSITWGNNIYNGGGQNIDTLNVKASDTYNFTLLEDIATQNPVMQGNALLTDFDPANDTLTLQLSPSLFKALDGAATQSHIKQITIGDLELATKFTHLLSSSPAANLDPDFDAYLSKIDPNGNTLTGTMLTFNNDAGGSISFLNDAPSTDLIHSINFSSFDDIKNFKLTVNFPYVPVAALPASQITASTPKQTAPFLYGGPDTIYPAGVTPPAGTSPYFNELDNFFANSLLATYSVTLGAEASPWIGATVSPTQVMTMGGTMLQNGANTTLTLPTPSSGNVTIDPFGTISVTNTVPFFAPLTITATDQEGHTVTTTQMFGFLDAPISVYGDAPAPSSGQSPITVVGEPLISNIINGGQNMEIVGQFITGSSYAKTTTVSGGTSLENSSATFKSSLIVDTAGNATAYGDFKAVNFMVQGADNRTVSSLNNAVDLHTSFTRIEDPQDPKYDPLYTGYTFNTNAIYVTDGISYGVTKDFTITVAGGNNATVQIDPQFGPLTPVTLDLDVSASFTGNQVTFQPQTLYGTGTLYGMMDQFTIAVRGGAAPAISVGNGNVGAISGNIDVSATVSGNTFTFSPASAGFPTSITVQGDTSATQITTVYGNINTLFIETTSPTFKVTIPALQVNTAATFANNHFIFGNEVLKGGVGSTVFYGHLSTFGDTFNATTPYYNGLVNGVTVSIDPTSHLIITDSNGNSITWGNTTYTGGAGHDSFGHNTYNFTIVEDKQGYAVMQGFDTITNFDPGTDTLVFNVQADLYARLGMATTDSAAVLLNKLVSAPPGSSLPGIIAASDGSGNTVIGFTGGTGLDDYGHIKLMGLNISLQNLANSVQVNELGTPYTPPTVNANVVIDPVFINGAQPDAFGTLVNSFLPVTWSVSPATPLPSGISLGSDGTLNVQVTGPVYGFVNAQAYDGVATVSLPSTLIMAINASDGQIHQDTGSLVMGTISYTQAFSTNTVGNTIIGGGLDIGYLASSAPSQNVVYGSKLIYDVSYTPGFVSHTVYGDVQNVSFFNNGTLGGAGTSGQTLTFSKNIIDTTGKIYGNVATLTMTGTSTGTGTGAGVNQVTNNTFIFGDDVLIGGAGPNDFYGHLSVFGNSDAPGSYGARGFYSGVTATTAPATQSMVITDANNNTIVWGNDTYIGGTGVNTYHFTVVPDTQGTPVTQGFDTITNFDVTTDKLVFTLPYALYATLDTSGQGLTLTEFMQKATLVNSGKDAVLNFGGGGSLTFQGEAGQLTVAQLTASASFVLADPITAIAAPVSPILVFGNTTTLDTFNTVFNTNHVLGVTLGNGITLNQNGAVSFGPTGIINTTFNTVTANDAYTTVTSTTSVANPVRVLALNAPVIDNVGDEQGSGSGSYVFIGHGNATITGGPTELDFTSTSNPIPLHSTGTFSAQSKLIYDSSGQPDTVYADGQSIVMTNDGTFNGSLNTSGQILNISGNFIEASGNLYGNFNTLTMTSTNGAAAPGGNIFRFGNDTLYGGAGADSFFGHLQTFGNSDDPTSYGLQGFYNGVTVFSGGAIIEDVNGNQIVWGNNTYQGGGGADAYNFTIVGTNDAIPQAVMQGFDTIEDFTASDRLNFKLAYPIYNQLAGGSTLTSAGFLNALGITQLPPSAVLIFPGGGSITLDGFGTNAYPNFQDLRAALTASITVSLADPITAVANASAPANNILIFTSTDAYSPLAQYFTYGHDVSLSFGGITGITSDVSGALHYGANTGPIAAVTNSLIAADPYTTVTKTFSAPVQVLALDGATILTLDQPGSIQGAGTGNDAYGLNPYILIGHGTATITGGITEIEFTATSAPANGAKTFSWQPKLIYDTSGLSDTVYGDGQSIAITNDGSASGIANTSGLSLTTGTNLIEASGNLYGNFNVLAMTSTNGAATPTNNTFTFGDDTLRGGQNADSFFGHLQVFGNSNNPASYGSQGFYNGVTASVITDLTTGENFVNIQDGNFNQITWGNNTYQGGGGADAYNFTIVGTKATTPQAVMQGFDTIQGFTASDQLNFKLAYPVYDQLAGGQPLTASGFLNALTITQSSGTATLAFPGGGSLTLDGFGTNTYPVFQDLQNALAASIHVSLADPIAAIAGVPAPTNNIIILGPTDIYGFLAQHFAYGHDVSLSFGGATITEDTSGGLNYGVYANSLLDTTTSSLTVADSYTSVPITFASPVEIVALDAPVTDQATGAETGSIAAGVFIGHGNTITGGGADVSWLSPNSNFTIINANLLYGNKLIYDNTTTGTGTVTGDVANIGLTAEGSTSLADASTIHSSLVQNNHIDMSEVWGFSNVASSTYGNAQNISLSAVGSVNVYSTSLLIFDAETISGNTIRTLGNTLLVSGDAFGVAQNISLTATDGFYAGNPGGTQTASISGNRIQGIGHGNILTGHSGSSENLYGDAQTLSLTINSPASSNGDLIESSDFSTALAGAPGTQVYEGQSLIENNSISWLGNTLVGGDIDTSLYAGVGKLVIENNEQALNNVSQPATSHIDANTISFRDSTETGMGGITAFYGDINDLTQTDFDTNSVRVIATSNGHVEVGDTANNILVFGNDTMNASSTGSNILNINLLASTDGGIVGEGHTTINNFGAPGASSLLNLNLSQALYDNISQANGGAAVITPSMVDAYLAAHNGAMSVTGNDTVITFNLGSNNGIHIDGSGYGSLTLAGVQASSLSSLGSELAITANGTMHIESYNATPTYNVTIQGDSIVAATQNVDIAHVSASGSSLIDMSGNLVLHMTNALFTSLGLSDSNTNAQNLQILQNDANTSTGGIAATQSTTGGVTDTTLTFESTVSGHINTYGSLTLHDTAFTVSDPLSAHLIVTHH